MYRIVYFCLTWLYHLIMALGHARIPLLICLRGVIRAVNLAWMRLLWALEHEALEACSVVLAVVLGNARHLGESPTLVAEEVRRTCGNGVSWAMKALDVLTSAVG